MFHIEVTGKIGQVQKGTSGAKEEWGRFILKNRVYADGKAFEAEWVVIVPSYQAKTAERLVVADKYIGVLAFDMYPTEQKSALGNPFYGVITADKLFIL